MTNLEQRLAKLQKQFHELRIMGGEGVNVYGDTRHGYAVEVKAGVAQSGATSGGGGDISGCTDPGACNFDGSATIDDSSCTYGGACCADTDCSITCEATCIGVYQGDDTICDPNPCACPEVTLVCDQICKTLGKCGNNGFTDSGLKYLTYNQDWSFNQSFTSTDEGCDLETDCCNCVYNDVHGFQFDYDVDACISIGTGCYGTTTATRDDACSGPTNEIETWSFDLDGICRPHPDDPYAVGCDGAGCSNNLVIGSDTSAVTTCNDISGPGGSASGSITETLSNEYTTELLISNIEARLPAYDDDFDDVCEAKKVDNSFGDQSNLTICRFKPKFTFASALIDFTINYNEHFEPQEDFGTGSPSDTPKSVDVMAGDTEAFGDEVMDPSDIGTITITDITVNCGL